MIEISDHLIQFLILEGLIRERNLFDINLFRRDLSNLNQREFYEEVITKVNWDEICHFQSKDPTFACKSFLDTINYHLDEYAPFKKVTRNELKITTKPSISLVILKKCKHRDALFNYISKETDPLIKNVLCIDYKKLVNLCFEVGVFPDILKLAKVISLYKKESKLDFLNYRPISLLSGFSKVYEKLIFTRIWKKGAYIL